MDFLVRQRKIPLLTIAIPTYNRAGYLGTLLSVLFDQVAGERRIELIVSDNASTDKTPEVVHKFLADGLPIRYIRNEINSGADGNILQCFEKARGKYVWICGDDDVILPGGVQLVLERISESDYDLVYLLHYSFRRDGSYVRVVPTPPIAAEVIEDVDVFVRRINHSLSFISGNIVNKERVMAEHRYPFKTLLGTNLVQLGWMYTALNNYRRGLYVYEQIIATGESDIYSYAPVEIFGPNLKAITDKWLDNQSLRHIIMNSVLRGLLPFFLLLSRRSPKASDVKSFRAMLTPVFRGDFQYWMFCYPLLVLPGPFAEWYWAVVRALNKIRRICIRLLCR